jgi:ABC-2 type transport system ATP-binding protein
MSGPAIVVSGVDYRYARADRNALTAIDLTVAEGGCFGLLGPNGAGKSTLLSLMTGVLAPQSGDILIAGHSVRGDRRAVRRLGALAPQDFAFYPALTGRENLAFFAGLHRLGGALAAQRIDAAVAATRLEDWLARPAETYSGGLKRRLNLAIALLGGPRILYLDEPTVGIDARSRQWILEAIKALKADGVTIVYTSHYMEEVEALCDAVAVIDQGRLVLTGRTDDLLADAAARRLLVTLTAPASPEAQAALADLAPDWTAPDRLELTLTGADGLAGAMIRLSAAGVSAARAEYGVSRLETLYLSLLNRGEAE